MGTLWIIVKQKGTAHQNDFLVKMKALHYTYNRLFEFYEKMNI